MKIFSLANTFSYILNHPLNRGRQLSAFWKFLSWHIESVLFRPTAIVQWVGDSKIIVRRGENSLTGNLYCGLMEHEDMCFILHYLRESDHFVDVGANVGSFTILASKVVGAKATAFEPLPDTYERLIDQIHLNRIEHLVTAKNLGVADKSGVLEFTNDKNCTNHVNNDPNNKNVTEVNITTLDSDIENLKSCVIKIDVEGYETNVLKGGSEVLASDDVKVVIVEMIGSGERFGGYDDNVHEKMLEYGFQPAVYDPAARKLTRIEGYNDDLNTIYLKDFDEASERCRLAPKNIVHTAGRAVI